MTEANKFHCEISHYDKDHWHIDYEYADSLRAAIDAIAARATTTEST